MSRTTFSSLLALTLIVAACELHAESSGDNWAAVLSKDAASEEAADTGIVGMSSDDLKAYTTAENELGGADDEVPEDFVRNRRRFVMREIKFNSDWDTDPTSLPAFIEQYKRRTGLDAQAMQPRKPLTFDDPELIDWPFVFMTAHNAFTLSDAEISGLQRYLKNGGFLHADDCLYGFPFGPAMHREIRKVLPEKELQPFNLEHPTFGTLLRQKYGWKLTNEAGLPMMMKANAFEAVELDGRMAVLYTPPDLGCMWEISSPPTPSNPLGTGMHNLDRVSGQREAGYCLGVNIVFYAMTH